MAEALRRLLWLLPIFGLGSLLLFALLSWGQPAPAGSDPLFFNPRPQGIREHAALAMAAVARGTDPNAPARLAKLGGAALPFVLPRLGELDEIERQRVALALAPVARRMGVARDDSVLDDPEGSVTFWTRFWQDRSLDFRDVVVVRLVRRLSQRSLALRRADLVQLDTYALPELIGKLGVVRTDDDVARARRLLWVASEITSEPWAVPADASKERTRRAVTACRRWWDDHRYEFTDVTGLRRLTAAVVQTRYARWAMRSLREVTGRDESELLDSLRARGRVTGLLLLSAFVGSLTIGGLGAAASLAYLPNAGRQLRVLAGVLVGLIVPGLAFWLPSGTLTTACLVSALLGAAPALHLFLREMDERLDWRGRYVLLGRSPSRRIAALGLWSNTLLPTWAPLAIAEATLLAFVLEWSWHLPGLGPKTIEAVRTADAAWLMAVCLSLGVLTALAQVVADALLGTGRPRGGEA
jgi:hypothetical protein